MRQCVKSCTVDVPIGRADRHDAFPANAIRGTTEMATAGLPQYLIAHYGGAGAREKIQSAVRSLD